MSDSRPKSVKNLNIALAHDWLVARRGGELVLDAIASELLNDGHRIKNLYTMFDSKQPITPAIDSLTRTTSSLNYHPGTFRRWLLPLYPHAVEQLSQKLAKAHESDPIDLLISTSSSMIKGIAPPMGVPHLCYCHAPARYLWTQRDQYSTGTGFKSRLRALGLDHFGDRLREWDKRTTSSVTQLVANSHFIAKQIREVYQRDSIVIHPPVRTDVFTPDRTSRTDRLLYVGAIEPYKRVDLAIEAARILDLPIDIIGTGSHAAELQRAYKDSRISFLGYLPDQDVISYFRSCKALIQPQIEDFGITAVEAQSCGCPVVARRAGGSLDSIIETKTGSFFDHPDPHELADAIERVPSNTGEDCRSNALRFSREAFSAKLRVAIDSLI